MEGWRGIVSPGLPGQYQVDAHMPWTAVAFGPTSSGSYSSSYAKSGGGVRLCCEPLSDSSCTYTSLRHNRTREHSTSERSVREGGDEPGVSIIVTSKRYADTSIELEKHLDKTAVVPLGIDLSKFGK